MPEPAPSRVTYPRRAWIAISIPFVIMIALLCLQLITVKSQHDLQVKADRKIGALNARVFPLLDAVAPRDLGDARKAGRDAAGLVRALARADAPEAIAATGELAVELRRANVGDVLAEGGLLARDLNEGRRLVGLIDRADRFLGLAEDYEVFEDVDRGADVAVDTNAIARETLLIQRETFKILKQSLAVQTESLQRLRSIDERTGGAITPP